MFASPLFSRFLLETNNLKSSTKFLLKKLDANFIPDSKKILEKPKNLVFTRTFLKSKFPVGP